MGTASSGRPLSRWDLTGMSLMWRGPHMFSASASVKSALAPHSATAAAGGADGGADHAEPPDAEPAGAASPAAGADLGAAP
eukprot:12417090-Alexandrium_andersonii.AAC.1